MIPKDSISTEEVRKTIGLLMKEIRIEKGLGQNDVAKRLACCRPNVTQYETQGVNSMDVILKFCRGVGIEPADFFSLLSSKISSRGSKVPLESLKKTLAHGVKDLCAREGLRCRISITIIK